MLSTTTTILLLVVLLILSTITIPIHALASSSSAAAANSLEYDVTYDNDAAKEEAASISIQKHRADDVIAMGQYLSALYNNYQQQQHVDDEIADGDQDLFSLLQITTKSTKHKYTNNTQHRKLGACSSYGWHPNTEAETGCTNNNIYPPPWERPELVDRMFYPTSDECCSFFFDTSVMDCPKTDACINNGDGNNNDADVNDSTTTTTTKAECKWHIDTTCSKLGTCANGCTNDNVYPSEWNYEPVKSMMFFTTAAECCNQLFSGEDVCEHYERDCDGGVIHHDDGGGGGGGGGGYGPPTSPSPTVMTFYYWVEESTGMCLSSEMKEKPHWIKERYPEYDACCNDKNVRDMDLCRKNRPITTNNNGDDANNMRGDETVPPTVTPGPEYYVEESTGICVSDHDRAKPHWIKASYQTYEKCCRLDRNVRDKNACLSQAIQPLLTGSDADDDNDKSSSVSPTTSPQPLYYLQDSTAICVNMHEIPMSYTKHTFPQYEKCCQTSWDVTKCLLEKPTESPSSNPTVSPSTTWPTVMTTCPMTYDSSGMTQYTTGSVVEVNNVIYKCKEYPASVFCNQEKFQPPYNDPGPIRTDYSSTTTNSELWQDAWDRVIKCMVAPSITPSSSPTTSIPTKITCKTSSIKKWHPGGNGNDALTKRICTNSNEYPVAWDYYPLSETYFAETAEECCSKFYDDVRCRIKNVCL